MPTLRESLQDQEFSLCLQIPCRLRIEGPVEQNDYRTELPVQYDPQGLVQVEQLLVVVQMDFVGIL